MKIFIVSFTEKGASLCYTLVNALQEIYGFPCMGAAKSKYGSRYGFLAIDEDIKGFIKSKFEKGNAIVFIGAVSIAVRYIAPYLAGKEFDPAVIAMDEKGDYIVPILSGHIGGANDLARKIASITGGEAVISTATDIQNQFSVDLWAVKNNYTIMNVSGIKHISSAVLSGEKVGLYSELPVVGKPPENFYIENRIDENSHNEVGICISLDVAKKVFSQTLNLVPKCFIVGIGCRKDVAFEDMEKFFLGQMKDNHIPLEGIREIASIDLKANEPALLKLSRKYGLKFSTYTSQELQQVAGDFTKSQFVLGVTGVDNVCERAAAIGNTGEFITRKITQDGITMAIFRLEWGVCF